ncbi:hypothetical protein R3W88_000833 [Solanum pinnatisectum]|uniref:Ubiquitin-like protease family profile domain-containing protein n=1 Tax=Solanum pinnatisectum TaxID=50273 RepID=A0AAV9MGS9_9SOLN|nr:hypothetical protein R3W88_000833 [Solanum pinnatisectum]
MLKGKEKLLEVHYPHDSDFEDEIPMSNRLRVNNDQCSKGVDGVSGSKGVIGVKLKGVSMVSKKRKKTTQPPKVFKADFIRVFNEDGLILEEDFFNMSMIYLISTFILSYPPKYSHIPKDHFLWVESGQYITQMEKDLDYEKFEGFSLIYFDHLKKGMFRKYGNQFIFKDLVFMDDELACIEAENLSVLTDLAFNKKREHDRYVRQNENVQIQSVVRKNDRFCLIILHTILEKIAQEVVMVHNDLEKFEKNVDAKFVEMKAFMDSAFKHIIEELKSLQNDVLTNKDLVKHMFDVDSENRFVTPLGVVEVQNVQVKPLGNVEAEDTHVTPAQHVRTKLPGKYAHSPYTHLSESGGTSGKTLIYCSWKHPFVHYNGFNMHNDVISHFQKFIINKLSRKSGKVSTKNPIDPPFEFGVGRHIDLIMYYLRKFCKYGPDNSVRVTTTDSFSSSGDAFHWFLVVFSIRSRCLYIYDSFYGFGTKHTKAVMSLVRKLSKMIPLFLVTTDYYGLRKDIDWNTDVYYSKKPVGDPLACMKRDMDISMPIFYCEKLCFQYGALLWNYGKRKIDTDAASEKEDFGKGGHE